MGMRSITVRKISLLLTAVFAGICIFAAFASVRLENAIFDSGLHKAMFAKYDVYTQMGEIAQRSLKDYMQSPGNVVQKNQKQQEQFVSFLENALTPQMIKLNIDSLTDGLVKYFRNETRFLPDVVVNPASGDTGGDVQTQVDKNDSVSGESIVKIDKINLSVLLMYLNRTDITDKLSVVRLFQFTLANIPLLAGLLFMLCFIAALMLWKKAADITKWLNTVFISAGAALAALGLFIAGCLFFLLPRSAANISLTVPLDQSLIVKYIRSWLFPSVAFFLIAGLLAFLIRPVSRLVTRLPSVTRLRSKLSGLVMKKSPEPVSCSRKNYTVHAVCAVLLTFVAVFSIIKAGTIKSEFLSNDLTTAVDRMKGITAFSRVVYAQDAAVYDLEIVMTDRKTGSPVPGIRTTITGKSANGRNYNQPVTSDIEGKASANLAMGSFKLSFDSASFPEDYKVPSPYLFEIGTAGTTVITISLDETQKKEPGMIEIQILDEKNMPVKGLELSLDAANNQSETAGSQYSFTNTEGVAAFRVEEGSYSAVLLESGFPAQYILPAPINAELAAGETVRYSMKLVKKQK